MKAAADPGRQEDRGFSKSPKRVLTPIGGAGRGVGRLAKSHLGTPHPSKTQGHKPRQEGNPLGWLLVPQTVTDSFFALLGTQGRMGPHFLLPWAHGEGEGSANRLCAGVATVEVRGLWEHDRGNLTQPREPGRLPGGGSPDLGLVQAPYWADDVSPHP